jgi:peptide/nickel transport system ATP-binding protein
MAGSGTAHLRGDSALLVAEDVVQEFPAGKGRKVHAVSGVSLDVLPGETLGLVGESGCGKSTTGRAIMQIPRPTAGSVRFKGTDLCTLEKSALRATRTKLQMIFQDPISSLNPRRKVQDIVAEPLKIWKTEGDHYEKVRELLITVGIDPDVAWDKHAHEFSGGQCQRISIARALVMEPELIICDEPVSALDVSVQAQILNLLEDMKERYGLSLIFIAHDLAVVKNVSDRVAVMYLGKICEVGSPDALFEQPLHPYTAALIRAIPVPDPTIAIDSEGGLKGELPSPIEPPSGCRFRTRCEFATDICANEEPLINEVTDGHFVACHHPLTEIQVTIDEDFS